MTTDSNPLDPLARHPILIELVFGSMTELVDALSECMPDTTLGDIVATASFFRLNLWTFHPDGFTDMPVSSEHWRTDGKGPQPSVDALLERALRDVLPFRSCQTHETRREIDLRLACDECNRIVIPVIVATHDAIRDELARAEGEHRKPRLPVLAFLEAAIAPFVAGTLPDDAGIRFVIRQHVVGSILGDEGKPDVDAYLQLAAPTIVDSPSFHDAAVRIARKLSAMTNRTVTAEDVKSIHREELASRSPDSPLAEVEFENHRTTVRLGRRGALGWSRTRDVLETNGEIPSHKTNVREDASDAIPSNVTDESAIEPDRAIEIRDEIETVRQAFEADDDRAALAAIEWKLDGITQAEAAKRHGVSVDALARAFVRVRSAFESRRPTP